MNYNSAVFISTDFFCLSNMASAIDVPSSIKPSAKRVETRTYEIDYDLTPNIKLIYLPKDMEVQLAFNSSMNEDEIISFQNDFYNDLFQESSLRGKYKWKDMIFYVYTFYEENKEKVMKYLEDKYHLTELE